MLKYPNLAYAGWNSGKVDTDHTTANDWKSGTYGHEENGEWRLCLNQGLQIDRRWRQVLQREGGSWRGKVLQCVRRNQALEMEPKQTVELLQASMLNKKNCGPWEEIRECKEIKKVGTRIAVLAMRPRSIKRSRRRRDQGLQRDQGSPSRKVLLLFWRNQGSRRG